MSNNDLLMKIGQEEESESERSIKESWRHFVWMADENGMVKQLDISFILEEYFIEEKPPFRSYERINILRREKYNAASVASRLRKKEQTVPPLIDSKSLLVREWVAHRDNILSLKTIKNPEGFITTSLDRHVKLWSRSGELWGDLFISNSSQTQKPLVWAFPMDWDEVEKKRVEKVNKVMEEIEKDAIKRILEKPLKAPSNTTSEAFTPMLTTRH